MKSTALLIFFTAAIAMGQEDYQYVSASFDVNNAFDIVDNPRTETDANAFDFDVEIGARYNHIAMYLFYGRYDAMNYINYGAGMDFVLGITDAVSASLGNAFTFIDRTGKMDYMGEGLSYLNPRGKVMFFFMDNFSLDLIGKISSRPDLGKKIFEGQLGITYIL